MTRRKHVFLFSIPGLRPGDVRRESTPTLYAWANEGMMAPLTPTFPCVTSPVQASMITGTPPERHGVIANGFYDRTRHEVEFWMGRCDKVIGETLWSALRTRYAGFTSAVWHAQNIKDADADFIVTPAPIHEADGATKLWCYSKPEGTYQRLLDVLGHFPLQHYWGPLSNIDSTKWILRAAQRLFEWHRPHLNWVYLPHLDYAGQKFGPDSAEAKTALIDLDRALSEFVARIGAAKGGDNVAYLVAGEYAMTPVCTVVYPNRVLREAGLLKVRAGDDGEQLDLAGSEAFAMVDHQLAHVFVRGSDRATVRRVAELFRGTAGVAGVYAGDERSTVGLNHPRSGEVILVSSEDAWFAYYWWFDDRLAPPFARTVDIHRKPGYDPVELFFDPSTKGIPLSASLVKGSHGVPATADRHRTALICSSCPPNFNAHHGVRDTGVKELVLQMFAAG